MPLSLQKKELSENIARLETVQRSLAEETETMVEELGDTESQEITAGELNVILSPLV